MVREFSAGGVVVRKLRGEWHVAVIEPAGRGATAGAAAGATASSGLKPARPSKSSKITLALPKGNIDRHEKPEQTALREVHEEAGIVAEPVTKLGDTKYVYVRKWAEGEKVFKVVSFFLLRYVSGKIGEITQEMRVEVAQALWIPLRDAPQRLSYKGEREMAAVALAYIERDPDLTGATSK